MLRLVVKQTMAHRGRLLLTFAAITLGVTFVVGTLVLTDTSREVFDDQFRDASTEVDIVIRDAVAFDAAMGVEVERDPLDAELTTRAASLPGVGRAIPVVKGTGLLIADGKAIVPAGPSMLTSWTGVDGFTLRDGHAPAQSDEVVIDAATATAHDITVGDTVRVQADREADLRVVGLVGFGEADGLPDTTVALTSLSTAQRLLRLGDGISQIDVIAADATATSGVAEDLRAKLGTDVDVAASQDTAAASAAAAKSQLGFITGALLALAGAALVIGAFLIANTFSVLVTQRTRELAVMRAAGATGRQVMTSILGEATVLGVAGAVAGTGAGLVAAIGLRALLDAAGATVPDGPTVLSARTLIVALAVGVVVTFIAAFGAARRASRISPVMAMREGALGTTGGRGRIRAGVGVTFTAVGVAALSVGGATESMPTLGAGTAALVAGLVALAPVVAPAVVHHIGRGLSALTGRGVPAGLAREAARRAPRRTGATVMALALSLALVVFVSVVGASVRAALQSGFDEAITAELVVESARGEMLGGLEPATLKKIEGLDEVGTVSPLRFGHWKDAGATRALTALDPATIGDVTDVDMVEGSLTGLTDGVVITERQAAERGLGVGDSLAMTFARTGTVEVPVVGLIDDDDAKALSTDYLVSLASYRDWFTERVDATLLVRPSSGTTVDEAQTALEDALEAMPTVEVRDQASAAEARTASLDGILTLITAVLMLTVLIAMLGITNTLALSIIERTRELGLLRAVGMTRRQLRTMIRTESLLIAVAGLLVGTTVGVATSALFVRAIAQGGDLHLQVPTTGLALVAAVALVVGVVGGLAPARRAARLEVLTAIRE
ncbi:ABC transporter permease [Nocardioides sp. zg-1230]|uniref:ABC transporter permease n=1 Tax=Nocardioides sp. zg-1230 TaxID=2736601 RepID=UPI0015535E81|nr:ABC transporter permease [Nocardioides sp. zg-1230]NPC44388.1 ABC transporter permease [Nocardioides sp. zg-1230]